MAKKVILKDENLIEVMPITRGELVLDSSGNPAFHSNEFLATDSQPGLMSAEDKYKIINMQASSVANALTLKINNGSVEGTNLYTYNGSVAKTLNIIAGDNITLTPTDGVLSISANIPTINDVYTKTESDNRYLRLSGGTLILEDRGSFSVKRNKGTGYGAYIQYENSEEILGHLGLYKRSDNVYMADVYFGDGSNYQLIHSGNIGNYLPVVTNYYWANVPISDQSNSSTRPTFATATANYYNFKGSDGSAFGYIGRGGSDDAITFGTYGGQFMNFMTNSTTRMHISSAGNVGINNKDPQAKLHVLGHTRIVKRLTIGEDLSVWDTNRAEVEQISPSGYATDYIMGSGQRDWSISSRASDENNALKFFAFLSDSIPAILTLEKTGIVTVSSYVTATRFHLSNTTGTHCGLMPNSVITTGGNAKDIWLYNNDRVSIYGSSINLHNNTTVDGTLTVGHTGLGYITSNTIILNPPQHTGGPFYIKNRDSSSNAYLDFTYGSTNILTFIHNGNVGIGTSSPRGRLDVGGEIYVDPYIRFVDSLRYCGYFNGGKYLELFNGVGASGIFIYDDGSIKTYRGGNTHTLIDSGNIGSQSVNYASSSGNADLLDGKHANDFYEKTTADGKFILFSKVSKSTVEGTNNAPHLFNIENENLITGYKNYWYVFNMGAYSGGNYRTQMAMPYLDVLTDSELFIRSSDKAGSWRAWRRVLHAGNYSSYLGYIGTTAVQSSSATQSLTGIGSINMAGDILIASNGDTGLRLIRLCGGSNDYGRIAVSATANNAGWMEIATADDATEPIYVRLYSGTYATLTRTLTLLDASGNTTIPNNLSVGNNLTVNRYLSFGYAGCQFTTDIRSSWRSSVFGDTTRGSRFRTLRTDYTLDKFSEIYGSGISWAASDTHGYLSTTYSSKKAFIGGGSDNSLHWTAELIHSENIGSQSVNYANSAGYASSAGSATYATNSTYLYASDGYAYGSSYPYYMRMRYNVNGDNRWYLSVSPETPKAVSVDHAYRAGLLYGYSSSPDNSHPGHGARVFYSWNIGSAGNATSGYSNGITIGSNEGDTNYGFQIVQNMWDDNLYVRRYDYGWKSWKTVAYTDTCIRRDSLWSSGSGQDVNNLKGATTFAYTDHGAATVGTIVAFDCGTSGGYTLQLQGLYNGENLHFRNRNGDNGTWNAWRYVIHSGNIGSQSVNYATSAGNTDTLDGYHEYSFLRYRDYTTTNGTATLWSQIGIRSYHGALPEGLSGLYNYGQVVSLPGGEGSRLDIFTNHVGSSESSGRGGLWWRSGWNTDKHAWQRIIDSGNIGSQSVNYATSAGNADTLDGYHYNGLPYISTSGGTATGTISACNSGASNPANAAFEAREYARAGTNTSTAPHSAMYAPRIGFHWLNRYWGNIIYYDSVFRFMNENASAYIPILASTVYGSGFYHTSYGSSAYALTSDGGAAHIGSMSVNYASSSGNADTVDGYHIWVGSSSSLPATKVNNTIYIII